MRFSDEVKAFLEAASFAVVCVSAEIEERTEAVLLVKSTGDVIDSFRAAGAGVRVGVVVERTASGPVVCLVFRAEGETAGDLVGESYFDAADPEDGRLFDLLGSQEVLRIGFLDENLEMRWVAELPWGEVR
ncbi:MAG: hypothetical protein HY900_25080, partial [Deltaproteobacteria bacterium]|nr:hypothetical protein [Deltaproteobacteria bacterium]